MVRATRSSTKAAALETKQLPQLSSPPPTPAPAPAKKPSTRKAKAKSEGPATPANTGRKRTRKAIKAEDEGDVNDLPHNLGTALPTPGDDDELESSAPPKKRVRKAGGKAKKEESVSEVKAEVKDELEATEATAKELDAKSTKKTVKKDIKYGLTPGVSPYPDYLRPTPEECAEVTRLLGKLHGKVDTPKAIPPPSLEVAGCGEVPSVLDALIRTRLSANTTNKNSSTAFQGLVKRFGTLKEGVGKGSVDWDAVRRAPQKDVFEAIQRGGLANVKSKDIQAILQMAYDENQVRSAAITSDDKDPAGADQEPESDKQDEVAKAQQNVISLDHIHLLSTPEAIAKMLKYPGIGPKTASCVALFCLQRPSFAVDTHVFRLCQYLGWVPSTTKKGEPKVDRNTTYSHCDARIPDEYKYPLHQLLIRHGKICARCRAATGQGNKDWEEGCPIEHLVKRYGPKKGGVSQVARKKAKKAAADEDEEAETDADMDVEEAPAADDGDDDEESELSDVPDDDE